MPRVVPSRPACMLRGRVFDFARNAAELWWPRRHHRSDREMQLLGKLPLKKKERKKERKKGKKLVNNDRSCGTRARLDTHRSCFLFRCDQTTGGIGATRRKQGWKISWRMQPRTAPLEVDAYRPLPRRISRSSDNYTMRISILS